MIGLSGEDGDASGFQTIDAAACKAVASSVVDSEVIAAVARDFKGLGVVVVRRVVRTAFKDDFSRPEVGHFPGSLFRVGIGADGEFQHFANNVGRALDGE